LKIVKNAVFCDVVLVRSDISEERIASVISVTTIDELGITFAHIVYLRSIIWLLVTANVVPSSPILVTLMMEAIRFSETSILTRATRTNILEDNVLHVRFEVFTAVTMKNGVFWDVTPCDSCKNRVFRGT
jgi:hypothetical protein